MSSIEAVCDSLGKTSLTPLVVYYWASDRLWVNSSPVKGEFIIFPLFLLEENAKLLMTARAGTSPWLDHLKFKFLKKLNFNYNYFCKLGSVPHNMKHTTPFTFFSFCLLNFFKQFVFQISNLGVVVERYCKGHSKSII